MFMRSQLERAINLAAKTGDKIIVVDEFNDRSSVVMNLDEYEKLIKGQNKERINVKNLTEEELLDKINRDIVSWKDANSEKKFYEDLEEDDDDDFVSPFADDSDDEITDEEDKEETGWTPPNFDADVSAEVLAKEEGNMIPDAEEDEPAKITAEPIATSPSEAKADEDENMYYYNDPEKPEAEKQEYGFTSIKDELKNKKHWEIPTDAKANAEEIVEEIPF